MYADRLEVHDNYSDCEASQQSHDKPYQPAHQRY